MINRKHQYKTGGTGRFGLAAALTVVAITSAPVVRAADAGMTVVKDPDTGQLRAPTAEEFTALEKQRAKDGLQRSSSKSGAAASASASAPMQLRSSNGAVGYRVGDAFLTYSVMKRNADGTMTMHCVTGADAAQKLLSAPQSSATETHQEHVHAR